MKIHAFLLTVLLAVPLLPGMCRAAETGRALKADVLRSAPYSDARKTGVIVRGETLQILTKKGAWLNVKNGKRASGWVRLLSVRRGTAGSGSTSKGVLDVASGRAGTGTIVATTGVRGLNEEELKGARYNAAEVKKLDGYAQTPRQGEQFARRGGLRAVKFAYLPEPKQKGGRR
ncbi:MAG: SH3 domain-containing protein [Syntrophales bacterium]|jgi:hypothetical protein|nr:SH3 domain-containing protein [Syntrophales bacterium]MDD4340565.1 SH3 domain-containing protein [Syntrophales bacterium]HOG06484.1 SH3 domain-containing protein [Syntrophales bacterium]HOS77094.1 SH3 domain-containing protein [Syntrophales bacterium]